VKNKRRNRIIRLLQLVLLAVVVWQLVQVGRYYLDLHQSRTAYSALEEEIQRVQTQEATETVLQDPAQEEPAPAPIQTDAVDPSAAMRLLKEKNEDAVGFIRIPEADIAYPIVQGTDNDEYLYQSFEGEYSIAGTVFMDWENHRDFSDPNTILYGHHMKDGSMFHNLSAFRQAAFQDTRIEIELIGELGIARYLVYSVYNVPQDAPYRRIHFTDAADVAAFIQETHKQSEILFDADPTGAKQIITLSTCTPNQEEYRIAVHALLLAE
jgi:sortase B